LTLRGGDHVVEGLINDKKGGMRKTGKLPFEAFDALDEKTGSRPKERGDSA